MASWSPPRATCSRSGASPSDLHHLERAHPSRGGRALACALACPRWSRSRPLVYACALAHAHLVTDLPASRAVRSRSRSCLARSLARLACTLALACLPCPRRRRPTPSAELHRTLPCPSARHPCLCPVCPWPSAACLPCAVLAVLLPACLLCAVLTSACPVCPALCYYLVVVVVVVVCAAVLCCALWCAVCCCGSGAAAVGCG